MKDIVLTDRGPKPIGPYSQGVRANGFLFISGQVAFDPATSKITGTDAAQQTQRKSEGYFGSRWLEFSSSGEDHRFPERHE
jgi:2-iminobutanoate/2-iminopropanoate deaminase